MLRIACASCQNLAASSQHYNVKSSCVVHQGWTGSNFLYGSENMECRNRKLVKLIFQWHFFDNFAFRYEKRPNMKLFAKDCLLTLVKSRLALGSSGCSFVRYHAKNGPIHRKMVADCPLDITSTVKRLSRPNQTRIIVPASLLHS